MQIQPSWLGRSLFAVVTACALPPSCAKHATALSGPTAKPSPTLPATLDRFESSVEDEFDRALVAKSADGVANVEAAWQSARLGLVTDAANPQAIATVDTRLQQLAVMPLDASPTARARQLNAIAEPLDQLFALYVPGMQPRLLQADYLGRELLLDGLESQWVLGSKHLADLKQTWQALRSNPKAAASAPAVIAFQNRVELLEVVIQQHQTQGLVQAARDLLEDVDGLEDLLLGDKP